ncbi:NFACT family protein [uncultured Eubacterium sp.]|uniref:Rqc2 family fibronectin-binding protein n=1 Tax=uncultured Eubacterium sp. TaxID=165185 RepID=UPI002598412C|nr:NFACT RNA binding domain-containing protein [uncultured Eubacterium sp.]
MAFDGITVHSLVHEFNENLIDGRITKIAQPEKDELLLTIKNEKETYRLVISVNPSLPLIYLTDVNKQSPINAPMFCMLLRKHINNGRILKIEQPDMERVVVFYIEHRNELGDLCVKKLIVELMGKHSNIIFTTDDDIIVDSIKHVTPVMSSVRVVMPNQQYFIPKTSDKLNPLTVSKDEFIKKIKSSKGILYKAIYSSFTGISPVISQEICNLSGIDSNMPISEISDDFLIHLYNIYSNMMEDIKNNKFDPVIYYKNSEPVEFNSFGLSIYEDSINMKLSTINEVILKFYAEKDKYSRIRQKSATLRHIVDTNLNKDRKKYDLQLRQLKDTEKADKFKVYGELLTSYSFNVEDGAKSFTTTNFYTGDEITIPLDEHKSAIENANKYFDKYNKLKRTKAALDEIIKETKESIDYLENISTYIDLATSEDDLTAIREELITSRYINKHVKDKRAKIKSKPLHYISSDGYDIYVGKNNLQNEEVTFKIANTNDWWFHAKNMPGSHVIVKLQNDNKEMPDRVFEEAGAIAAFYSKAKGQSSVEIDYTKRKHLKKVAASKPGFVIYHTNYSLVANPDISNLTLVE